MHNNEKDIRKRRDEGTSLCCIRVATKGNAELHKTSSKIASRRCQ